ncbi:unnamed protein product, partial [Phaeothamnion confervicola]
MSGVLSKRRPQPWVHALAGALGGILAATALYPLDNIRFFLQVDDELAASVGASRGVLAVVARVAARHGRLALWRGCVPNLVTMGVGNFVYFWVSAALAAAASRRSRSRAGSGIAVGSVGKNMFISTLAGIVNVLLTTPLWVAATRIKSVHGGDGAGAPGLATMMAAIYADEGMGGLWAGTVPSILLVSNPIIQFVAYEALKANLAVARGSTAGGGSGSSGEANECRNAGGAGAGDGGGTQARKLRSYEALWMGACAKIIATVATYPLQLAQSKMRTPVAAFAHSAAVASAGTAAAGRIGGGTGFAECFRGTAQCLAAVWRAGGTHGLYQGLRTKLLYSALMSALMFLAYEKILSAVTAALEA